MSRLSICGRKARITPAGAGKTVQRSCSAATARDHPRRCGENGLTPKKLPSNSGSPPQVRGKHAPPDGAARSTGITPAGAGKTASSPIESRCTWDHPRRCGENLYRLRRWSRGRGSPPQVRGKRRRLTQTARCRRITPAGAGKTEYAEVNQRVKAGSPPQVRGKPRKVQYLVYDLGITPAGAGKTG